MGRVNTLSLMASSIGVVDIVDRFRKAGVKVLRSIEMVDAGCINEGPARLQQKEFAKTSVQAAALRKRIMTSPESRKSPFLHPIAMLLPGTEIRINCGGGSFVVRPCLYISYGVYMLHHYSVQN